MTKVYVAMINDRHTDPEPEVFSDLPSALAFLEGYLARYGDEVERDDPPPGRWLFSATYGVEDDSVWIVEKPLHVRPEVTP